MKTLLSKQKRDANEKEIATALRAAGAMYLYLDKSAGFDALVVYAGHTWLVEIKMPGKLPNLRELEAQLEIEAHGGNVHILHDVDDAMQMIGNSAL